MTAGDKRKIVDWPDEAGYWWCRRIEGGRSVTEMVHCDSTISGEVGLIDSVPPSTFFTRAEAERMEAQFSPAEPPPQEWRD